MIKVLMFALTTAVVSAIPAKADARPGPGRLEVFCHKNGVLLWHEQFYRFDEDFAYRAAAYCERVEGGKATMKQIRR
ncbi:hypothetical protein [Pseudoalteromonas luteoviolacea]|uniref:Uncharacterized protein n=1 Tax=Pseudoalteromonas luteoviolacea S4054 TaxID=1129367 RepID=A0A0F6A879_9GAMM|nr:hypothetical protein [Pseudoalteromonas luteoviolacea]AOT07650.1 hypothetical protein S4054249_07250 [Pseudoalteromonas luteoviolacea]AOT12566.1 hypothetical protein S40542_07250 [Pseudoalteromonas luteoviolacea]AOT17480.1 hypothetical protein S4054_07250 [Pseudoalteromonas luteoviolacea]KKE82422.1 hypothetical protein N479_18585 [Pseudoalteromonas luteoviolacea S4054]KZN66313.1 hypothetical protein N481_24265 [Pseudoalteromonas luteoviolacea S4047-1]